MKRTSYIRRGIGFLVAAAPVAPLVASLVHGVTRGSESRRLGLAVTLAALAIAALNFHLSFLRERLYLRANGSREGYRNVSVVPIVGTALVVVGAVLGFGSSICATLGLLAVALDTGGFTWFVICTWGDASLWDRSTR